MNWVPFSAKISAAHPRRNQIWIPPPPRVGRPIIMCHFWDPHFKFSPKFPLRQSPFLSTGTAGPNRPSRNLRSQSTFSLLVSPRIYTQFYGAKSRGRICDSQTVQLWRVYKSMEVYLNGLGNTNLSLAHAHMIILRYALIYINRTL